MSTGDKGRVIAGKFRLERRLGQGGMGTVWIATHVQLDAPVAVKILEPWLSSSPEMLARFEREARSAAQLRGAHVVQIFDCGVDGDVPFIAMELLEGEDLAARLKREGRLPFADTATIVTQVAAALKRAHAAGIVHRDLKPGNVFLATDQGGEVVKILDFGVAKDLKPDSGDVTKTGDLVGSPLYMSPEQVRGARHVDCRTDNWALGVIAFKALTGKPPFAGESSGEILVNVATQAPLVASALVPDLPAGVDAFFARALEKDPARRFQTAREMAEAFAALSRGAPLVASVEAARLAASMPAGEAPAPAPGESTASAASITARGSAGGEAGRAPGASRRVARWAALAGLLLGAIAATIWGIRAGAPVSAPAAPSADATDCLSATTATATAPVRQAIATGNADESSRIWNIPLGDSRFAGAAAAPVTIVEFAEYQCPLSRRAEAVVARILETYRDKVRLVWKDFQIVPHAYADPAARLVREALAEGGRDVAWAAHRKLFEAQRMDDQSLLEIARELRLDPVRAAREGPRHQAGIDADTALGDAFEVMVTPTFFINGRRLAGLQPFERFQPLIDEEIERAEAIVARGTDPKDVYATLLSEARGAPPPERRTVVAPPDSSPRRGDAGARILVQEFGDFDDPQTRVAESAVREVLDRYRSKVTLIWRDRPLSTRPGSSLGAAAAREAFAEKGAGAFWSLHDRMLGHEVRGGLTPVLLDGFARELRLDPVSFRAGLANPGHTRSIDVDAAAAAGMGTVRTPAFVISQAAGCGSADRIEGYFLDGPQPFRKFKRLIDRALAE